MATFTRFDKYKLLTEFLDGNFKHTIVASPSRVETWERLHQLGEGGFGTVYRERCRETGAVRAVKQIRKSLAKSNEIGVLMKLSSVKITCPVFCYALQFYLHWWLTSCSVPLPVPTTFCPARGVV
jgi:serine/threonine protein kinase